jgi:hypothetical protein
MELTQRNLHIKIRWIRRSFILVDSSH